MRVCQQSLEPPPRLGSEERPIDVSWLIVAIVCSLILIKWRLEDRG